MKRYSGSTSRRGWLKATGTLAAGTLAAGSMIVPRMVHAQRKNNRPLTPPPTPFPITPFTAPLPIPQVIQPLAVTTSRRTTTLPFTPGDCFHGIAKEFADLALYQQYPLKYYRLSIVPAIHEFIPGVKTPVWTYNGVVPGPTFRTRIGEPIVVRVTNNLGIETSVHLHGGHTPSHADGFPTFYTEPGKERDYFYPNTVPLHNGSRDYTESVSTCWYHDHAMDITGHNAYSGLAGFYLASDALEDSLIGKVLPALAYDVPMIFGDKRLNADGTLYYDFLDHDGALGDVFTVNGKVQPYFPVQKRKYRLRLCNGSNARFYQFRLSTGEPFVQIGKDAWLLPFAMQRDSLILSPGQRVDIIVDFTNAPKTVYLENILEQVEGRKPDGIAAVPTPLVRFDVGGTAVTGDVTIKAGTLLRQHRVIDVNAVTTSRTFELGRSNGSWTINSQLYDPFRIDARIPLGATEKWTFVNGSGGWWHPMHIHLESHQVLSINGVAPPAWESFKSDTTILPDSTTIEILMKFRTFAGPFVFHCHNMEHEDMRMMMNFETF